MHYATTRTLLGDITIFADGPDIVSLDWGRPPAANSNPAVETAIVQLQDYLAGERRTFDLSLRPSGTDFQIRCWDALLSIPFGETRTYGALVELAGGSPRALGMACGANPIPIFIPCHRVVGAKGKLGGYSAGCGPETKALLLRIEAEAAT